MDFPKLYKKDKKSGKTRFWSIRTEGNLKITQSGLVDGKVSTKTRACQSKNVGKKNETTLQEQASLEARREWIKKIHEGRKPAPDDSVGIEMMTQILTEMNKVGGLAGGMSLKSSKKPLSLKSPHVITDLPFKLIKPMKAKIWTCSPHENFLERMPLPRIQKYFDLKAGVWVQPKLDGVRCAVTVYSEEKNNKKELKVVMSSNNQKQFPWLEHLRLKLKALAQLIDLGDGLDGELYIHGTDFSLIQSMTSVARSKPHPNEEEIEYHVFDLLDRSGKMSQQERFKRLDAIFEVYRKMGSKKLVQVPTFRIKSYLEVNTYHNKFTEQKYEGVMIRAEGCCYLQDKSNFLQKYKSFQDAEFKIVGIELDPGVTEENFVWLCETKEGKPFKAKQTGPEDFRKNLYWTHLQTQKYLGKWLTVRYQELSKDQIPRFPVALHVREGWDIS